MDINYEYTDEIDSTNSELKRRALTGGCKNYDVLSAGMQTVGRGRSGHTWSSPKGTSISTSMILFPPADAIEFIYRITPIAAMAVAEAIEELYGLKAQIKWPNDVLLNEKKICGILNELIPAVGDVPCHVVVGIGVNVHIREFSPELSDIATSLDLELEAAGTKITTHCEDITKSIWEHFVHHYESFLQTFDLRDILEGYNERLVNKDRQVCVLDPKGTYNGKALGVDAAGALFVLTDDGERIIDSGEVSVRGIYGYV